MDYKQKYIKYKSKYLTAKKMYGGSENSMEYLSDQLLLAAKTGKDALIVNLLEKNAKPNVQDCNGTTPLIMAAQNGHVDAVNTLLFWGITTIDMTDNMGRTALIAAIDKAPESQITIVNALLAAGACIDKKNNNGETALMLAAKHGCVAVVDALLKVPMINVDEKDSNGETALMRAAEGSHWHVVNILIDAGADINAKNNNGYTVLILAIEERWRDGAVKALITRGANLDAEDNDGDPPLIIAAWYGGLLAAETLLDYGVDINTKDKNDNTALMIAAHEGQQDMVTILLARGADLNMRNNNGDTALVIAAELGHQEVAKVLLAKGIAPQGANSPESIRKATGRALSMYERSGCAKVLKAIREAEQLHVRDQGSRLQGLAELLATALGDNY